MKLKNYHLVFPRIPSLIIHKAALTTVEIHVTKQQSIYIHLTYSCILYCISLYKVCTRSLLSNVLSKAPSMQKWRPLEASFDSACGIKPGGGSIGFSDFEAFLILLVELDSQHWKLLLIQHVESNQEVVQLASQILKLL